MTVTAFLVEVGYIFQAVVGWISDVATAIASNGILLTMVAVPLIFLGVNMFRRLMNVQ